MTTRSKSSAPQSDPAALFAIAHSLWNECHRRAATKSRLSLGDSYGGMDAFMREAMRIASTFEEWACRHVDFEELTEIWPYLLQDRFGRECLSFIGAEALSEFDELDCRRIAARMKIPIR